MTTFETPQRAPRPTVDLIIELLDRPPCLVLIQRRNPPHGYALPGGFVDPGESLSEAACREALEETGLTVELLEQFHTYSDPARDTRMHTISTVFIGRARGVPRAGDDAADTLVVDPHTLPSPIVFDHRQILDDYVQYRRTGERPPARR
jgi:8-oxo-dGTP diphosphatase